MNAVDPNFMMVYGLRNDQEDVVRRRRHATQAAGSVSSDDDRNTAVPSVQCKGTRWAFVVGLALLTIGTGVQLGVDQYNMHKASRQ